MQARKRFVYDVILASPDGKTHEVEYETYWSPARIDHASVAVSAAAEFAAQGAKVLPVSATPRG